MPRPKKPIPDLPDKISLAATLTRVPGTTGYAIDIVVEPQADRWRVLAYFMEVVGTLANSQVGSNPLGISDAEDMAQQCSQYITGVIMSATAPNERENESGSTTDREG